MPRRFLVIAAALVILPLLLAACSGEDAPTPTATARPAEPIATPTAMAVEPVTLRVLSAWSEALPVVQDFLAAFEPAFEEASGGLLKIELAGDPATVPAFEQLQPVQDGLFDVGLTHTSYHSAVRTLAAAQDLIEADYATRDSCGLNAALSDNYERMAGVKYFPRLTGSGIAVMLGEKVDVSVLPRLDGLSIRSYPTPEAFLTALGATPVTLPGGDVYSALDRGTVDGAVGGGGVAFAYGLSWDEVTKYLVKPYLGETVSSIVVNLDVWDSLTPQHQAFFTEAMEIGQVEMRRIGQASDAKFIAAGVANNGIEVIELEGEARQTWLDTFYEETSQTQVLGIDATEGAQVLSLTECVRNRS